MENTTPIPQQQKISPAFYIFIGLVMMAMSGAIGYWLGSRKSISAENLPTPIAEQPAACTLEAKICPDGTAVGRTGPNCEFAACPESVSATWQRKQYASNGQVVWDLLQPAQTVANESGLLEGYLTLESTFENSKVAVTFSYPNFMETGLPISLDKWVEDFNSTDLGDVYINRTISDFKHPQSVSIKIIKTTQISAGGIEEVKIPTYFVFIWQHQDSNGQKINPAMVVIKPVAGSQIETKNLDIFTEKLIGGIKF